jgi:hypothetical protein
MLSKEDQRRFDQIARHLRMTDPEFFARVGDQSRTRRNRLLVIFSVVLCTTVPPMAAAGGYAAGVLSAGVLLVAGVLLAMARRC